jgi:hypothetical protein
MMRLYQCRAQYTGPKISLIGQLSFNVVFIIPFHYKQHILCVCFLFIIVYIQLNTATYPMYLTADISHSSQGL